MESVFTNSPSTPHNEICVILVLEEKRNVRNSHVSYLCVETNKNWEENKNVKKFNDTDQCFLGQFHLVCQRLAVRCQYHLTSYFVFHSAGRPHTSWCNGICLGSWHNDELREQWRSKQKEICFDPWTPLYYVIKPH